MKPWKKPQQTNLLVTNDTEGKTIRRPPFIEGLQIISIDYNKINI